MFWLFPALLAPFFYALATTLDAFVANRRLPRIPVLIFYVSCFNLLYVPLVFLFGTPRWFEPTELPVLLLVGLTGSAYLFPYYYALQNADTSVVISLFSLTRLFIPMMAFLFVGERLAPLQYVGFALIVFAGAAVSFDPKHLRLNRSLLLMGLAALIISIGAVAQKYAFQNIEIPWATLFAWQSVFAFVWITPLLLLTSVRRGIRSYWPAFRRAVPIIGSEELSTFAATAAGSYAVSLAPVTYISAVSEFTPFFGLLIALVAGRTKLGAQLKEHLDKQSIKKKMACFAIMLIGALLMGSGAF